jgi:transcriptional regulator with XRE-family HTH domain
MPQERGVSFSEMLKYYRKQQGYTQAKAAAVLGYSKESIAAWECGRRFPTNDDLPRLASMLGLDLATVTRAVNEPRLEAYTRKMYGQMAPENREEALPSLPSPTQDRIEAAQELGEQGIYNSSRRELLHQASGLISGALIAPDVLEQILVDRLTRVLTKPSSIDNTTLQYLEYRTDSYWRDRHGAALASCDLLSYVIDHLQKVIVLLEGSLLPTIRMRLCSIVSEIAQLAGHLLFDMGEFVRARNLYQVAIISAQEGGNQALEAVARGRMSFVWTYSGNALEALGCIQEARHLAVSHTNATVCAYLAVVEAEIQSILGNQEFCLKSLGAAACVEDRQYSKQEMHWLHFDYSRLAGYQGTCFKRLYHPEDARTHTFLDRAQRTLADALTQLDPAHVQRRPALLIDIAGTYAQQGEVEGACGYAIQALPILAQTKSQTVAKRLLTLRQELERWHETQYVKNLDQQMTPLITSAGYREII